VEYTWPNPAAIDMLIADGMNLFRVPFRMERLAPDAVDGPLAEEYLGDLIEVKLFPPSPFAILMEWRPDGVT
jgi:endoglucanase